MTAAPTPTETADRALREAMARDICIARGLNPDCQHEGPADDNKIDGYWDRRPTANCTSGRVPWHYGWRNQTRAVDQLLSGSIAALHAENKRLKAALKPFCFGDPTIESILYDGMPHDAPGTFTIKLGDIRAARAALQEPKP